MKKRIIVSKTDPEFKEWIRARRRAIEAMTGVPVTLIDTQRIIAKTKGVEINKEIIKKALGKFK